MKQFKINPAYIFFVVNKKTWTIVSGWEEHSDATDSMSEFNEVKPYTYTVWLTRQCKRHNRNPFDSANWGNE